MGLSLRLLVATYVYRQISKVAYPAADETSFHFCSYVHGDIKMCKNLQSLPNDSVAAVKKENVKNDGLLYCFFYITGGLIGDVARILRRR